LYMKSQIEGAGGGGLDNLLMAMILTKNKNNFWIRLYLDRFYQGCGSGLIKYGSGSIIFAQSGSSSGSGSKLKQNFRSQFLSQILWKSKFESNQIKNTVVIHQFFSKSS
jgi:hypothetical protein